jgi:hypothetical protein
MLVPVLQARKEQVLVHIVTGLEKVAVGAVELFIRRLHGRRKQPE